MKLDDYKKKFNSKQYRVIDRESKLTKTEFSSDSTWGQSLKGNGKNKKTSVPFLRFFIFSLFVFGLSVLAMIIFVFFGNQNKISGENIEISVQIPNHIESSMPTDMTITLTNKNTLPILATNLIISYPYGTREIFGNSSILNGKSVEVGSIDAGSSAREIFSASYYGVPNESQIINIKVEYRIPGSKSLFVKNLEYPIKIAASPISLSVSAPETVRSGSDFSITLEVLSNGVRKLENIIVRAKYPAGFIPTGSSLNAVDTNISRWTIDSIRPKEKRRIKIDGVLSAESGEKREFVFEILVGDTESIDSQSLIAREVKLFTINEPIIVTEVFFNRTKDEEVLTENGDIVNGSIKWKHIGEDILTAVKFSVKLNGQIVDHRSVSVRDGGIFDGLRSSIVWQPTYTPQLRHISPGDSGRFDFSFNILPYDEHFNIKQRSIESTLSIEAKRVENSQEFPYRQQLLLPNILLRSNIVVLADVLYNSATLSGYGPVPPVAGKETVYILSLRVNNNGNRLEDSMLFIPLTSNSIWAADQYPSSENLKYDEAINTLIWDIGIIGENAVGHSRFLEIPITIQPRINEEAKEYNLTGELNFKSFDTAINKKVDIKLSPRTTRLQPSA